MKTKRNFFPTALLGAMLLGLCFASTARAADGSPVWTNLFRGGYGAGYAQSLAVDGSGNVYVTGNSYEYFLNDYATIKYSNAGVPLWTNLFNRAANSDDYADSLAVDGSGDVYVTGTSYNTGGTGDYATIKYSSAGIPQWTNLFNSAANSDDRAKSLAVDGGSNVIVTGYSKAANGYYDYATIKYSSAGVPLWTNLFNGVGDHEDVAKSLAVDGSGNVYVAGYSAATVNLNSADYATIKYSNAGVPLWTNLFNGAANNFDSANSLAVDGSNNVVVTGHSGSGTATIKYSSSGVPLWTNLFNGAANSGAGGGSLAIDSSGNVVFAGSSTAANGYSDYATIKYSNAGVPLWTNLFNGPANDSDSALSLTVDGSGNVYVTGSSTTTNGYDYATIKYSSAGVPLWTNLFNGLENNYAQVTSLAVDGSGNAFVTGYSTYYGLNYYTTIKYSGPSSSLPSVTAALLTDGNMRFSYVGIAGTNYALDRAFSLNSPSWSPQATNTADGTGAVAFTNMPNQTTANFWRVRSVP